MPQLDRVNDYLGGKAGVRFLKPLNVNGNAFTAETATTEPPGVGRSTTSSQVVVGQRLQDASRSSRSRSVIAGSPGAACRAAPGDPGSGDTRGRSLNF